jgi:hypothetical protein
MSLPLSNTLDLIYLTNNWKESFLQIIETIHNGWIEKTLESGIIFFPQNINPSVIDSAINYFRRLENFSVELKDSQITLWQETVYQDDDLEQMLITIRNIQKNLVSLLVST